MRAGESLTLSEAMKKFTEPTLFTGTVKGVAAAAAAAPVGVAAQGRASPNYSSNLHFDISEV